MNIRIKQRPFQRFVGQVLLHHRYQLGGHLPSAPGRGEHTPVVDGMADEGVVQRRLKDNGVNTS